MIDFWCLGLSYLFFLSGSCDLWTWAPQSVLKSFGFFLFCFKRKECDRFSSLNTTLQTRTVLLLLGCIHVLEQELSLPTSFCTGSIQISLCFLVGLLIWNNKSFLWARARHPECCKCENLSFWKYIHLLMYTFFVQYQTLLGCIISFHHL